MSALDRYLTRENITTEAFAASLRAEKFRASDGWIRQIRGGHAEPSKRLARAISQLTGRKVKVAQLINLTVDGPAPASAAVEAA